MEGSCVLPPSFDKDAGKIKAVTNEGMFAVQSWPRDRSCRHPPGEQGSSPRWFCCRAVAASDAAPVESAGGCEPCFAPWLEESTLPSSRIACLFSAQVLCKSWAAADTAVVQS